jgi:hypothetical protein
MFSELIAAGALVSQSVDPVQWVGYSPGSSILAGVGRERNPIEASQAEPRKLSGSLQPVHASVIIKFDLPSSEAFHYAPAVARREISNVRFGHSSEDS